MKLGDILTLQRGTTYKGSLLGHPGPFLLGLASIKPNGGFRDDSLKTYGGESPEKLLLKPGDLYVSLKDVTQSADLLGAVSRVPKHIEVGRLTQDTVKLIFTNKAISLSYIYWLLRTPDYREYCRARSTGTTNLGLSRDDFFDFPVPEPTSYRLNLVNLLENIESKIEVNRRMNVTLESMAQAVFHQWFVENEDVGNWKVGRLDDLLILQRGFDLPSPERKPGLYPILAASGPSGTHNEYKVKGPGVTTGRSGVIGNVYFVHEDFWPLNTSLWVKEYKLAKPAFSYYLMGTLDFETFNAGSAVPTLNRNHVHNLSLSIPPIELIEKFENFAMSLLNKVHSNEKESRSLASLRDSLLPKLMRGEVRMKA